jgi:MerR family transcriptional regulator, copper efflux regulator
MGPRVTIGQAARTSGVPARTIRYYEQVGLLPPPSRAASGYRLYDRRQVERLRFVGRARALGLPLRQLTALMGTLNGWPRPALRRRLRALVGEQLDVVNDRIDELRALRRQLERVVRRTRTLPAPAGETCRCLETRNVRLRRGRGRASRSSYG